MYKMGYRILWVDYVKAINIFFVVLGHTVLSASYTKFIYAFHIPLFFFLSGYFFDYSKYPNFFLFFKKRFHQLLIPYFIINFLTYLAWLLIGRHTGEDALFQINLLEPFYGIFYGGHKGYFLHHNAPMWFLPCLFSTEMIFYLLFKSNSKILHYIFIVILLSLGVYGNYYQNISLPWGLSVVPTTAILYGLGSWFNHNAIQKFNYKKYLILIPLSFLGLLIFASFNIKVKVSAAEYGNYFYFWMAALWGILFFISIGNLVEYLSLRFKINLKFLQFIGQNTLLIFSFHLVAGGLLKGFTYYLLKLPLEIYQLQWVNHIYSLSSILLLVPVILIVNKYTPWLAGKRTA